MKHHGRDYAVLSRLLDEGLGLPPEQRRAWITHLPPIYAGLKPRLGRMLLKRLPDEAGDLIAVAKLIHAALSARTQDEVAEAARRERLIRLTDRYRQILRGSFRRT